MIEFDNLTYLHGKPQGTGLLKANPEDFVVVEDLGFEPDGEGEHILVRILKNGCNTRFVADALAKFLKIHARELTWQPLIWMFAPWFRRPDLAVECKRNVLSNISQSVIKPFLNTRCMRCWRIPG